MKYSKAFSVCLIPIVFTFVIQTKINSQTPAIAKLEFKIDSIFNDFNQINKPGAAVAVVKDQEIVFKKAYGSANLEYDIPNKPSTIFHIASVSKQFTVFSILLLESEGKLSFDDDIRKYIPEVPDFGQTITLKHLASHTSGLRDQWTLLSMAGWRFDDVITKEHILKLVSRQKELNFSPGDSYMYSNTGFTLLAEVVARISNKSFAEFTQERIFKPLKMDNTLFYDDHEKIVKNRAYSYYLTSDNRYKKSVLNYANVGATSLFTTVEDLALWSINFSLNKVGNRKIINKMNELAVLNSGETFGGAYGQFISNYKGLNQIRHAGADAGYRSYLGRFPDQNFAVMVLSNSAHSNPEDLALQVSDLYLQNFYKSEETSKLEKVNEEFITLPTRLLEKFTGHYWNDNQKYARKIYVKNDTLRYYRNKGNESILLPISTNLFRLQDDSIDFKILFSKTRGVRHMNVIINGEEPTVFSEFTPPNYKGADLLEFGGRYYSPELDTTYEIILWNDKLTFTHPRSNDFIVSAAKSDVFVVPGFYSIQFERNNDREIIGFRISAGRAQNLWFKKIE